MDNIDPDRLTSLGLSPSEARAYLTLVRNGPMGAASVAEAAAMTRSSAYAALGSLVDLSLAEAGAGYGSRFRAAPPEQAIPALIDRQREAIERDLAEREVAAKALAEELAGLAESRPPAPEEIVEIIRDRRAMAERYERIQLEATEEIASVVKAPFVTGGDPNPAQEVALNRKVRVRGLYERDVLDHPEIGPYLQTWLETGEEIRVYPGVLPLKFQVIDRRICLLPLETPNERSPFTTLLIRHDALGEALRLLYEFLWRESGTFG